MDMEVNTLTLNIDKVCRVCLSEDTQMFSIYSELYEEENCGDELPHLHEIIMSLSSMKIRTGDGLPESICTKCVENAHNSFIFQKCCNRSQTILEAYINQRDKECNTSKDHSMVDNSSTKEGTKEPTVKTKNIPNKDEEILVLNENDLDLAENYIKESLSQETQDTTEIRKDSGLDPDEFFATNEESVGLKSEIGDGGRIGRIKGDDMDECLENSDEEGIGNLRNYEKMLPTGEKFFACKMCDRIYKNGSSLRAHIKGHHKKKRPYKCEVCGKGFRMYGSFFYHKRMHSGEQPHACKVCGKKYKQSGSLTVHMRVHTGQRPYLCSVCGRGFRQQPDLNYHLRTHTKEKPYQCTVCGKTMAMQSHLVQHMRTHTGERPFKCSQCEKAFPSSTCLKRHEIIHTGKKPFTCEVCQKSFNRNSSLMIHSKTHTDERPHVCPVCHKGFIQAHTLKSHLVTHSLTVNKQTKVSIQDV